MIQIYCKHCTKLWWIYLRLSILWFLLIGLAILSDIQIMSLIIIKWMLSEQSQHANIIRSLLRKFPRCLVTWTLRPYQKWVGISQTQLIHKLLHIFMKTLVKQVAFWVTALVRSWLILMLKMGQFLCFLRFRKVCLMRVCLRNLSSHLNHSKTLVFTHWKLKRISVQVCFTILTRCWLLRTSRQKPISVFSR